MQTSIQSNRVRAMSLFLACCLCLVFGQRAAAQPMTGACCLPNGTCTVTDTCDCATQGGEFVGFGVTCANANCAAVVFGACCEPGGTCFTASQANCTSPVINGTHFPGQTCAQVGCGSNFLVPCCCANNCVMANQRLCALGGGTPQPGMVCTAALCGPPTGVCCDPATGNCQAILPCPNGWTQVSNSTCTPNPCPPAQNNTPCGFGACCFNNAGCIMTYACECLPKAGGFFGVGTTCTNVNCAQEVFGACCTTNSNVCVSTTLAVCNQIGGQFFPNMPCGQLPVQCGTSNQACCCCDKCIFIAPEMCQLAGGTVLPVGTPCQPFPCPPVPTGACCNPFTLVCNTNVYALACQPPNQFFPNGTCVPNPCVPNPCLPGACCDLMGICMIDTSCHCLINGGDFQGTGTVCSMPTCPVPVSGSCCLNSGATCIDTNPNTCAGMNGQFFPGLPCGTPGHCPPTVAACCCCNICYNIDPYLCTYAGGTPTLGVVCQNPGGPCGNPPLGACCDAQGNCTQTTAANCPVPPNVSWTANGSCNPNLCPAPCSAGVIGACCDPNGVCYPELQCKCVVNGGDWMGGGSVCGQVACPASTPGACCINNGTCVTVSSLVCANLNATFFAFQTCTTSGCTKATRTCCCCGDCSVIDPALCQYLGGTVQPVGVACQPTNPCGTPPTGACCDAQGNCTQTTAANCPVPPNVSWTPNATCAPNNPCVPCPQGACCMANGVCIITDQCNCVLNGGSYIGPGTTCMSSTCLGVVLGSCCIASSGTCVDVDQTICNTIGGLFSAGVPCTFNPCIAATAACCCCNHCFPTDPKLCILLGGTPSPGITCAPGSACIPLGACCDANGLCTYTTAANCPVPPNLSWTPGGTCNPSPCPVCLQGACCLNGLCFQDDQCNCLFQGGSFLGAGTPCGPPCPLTSSGACCVPPSFSCVTADNIACAAIGGTFIPNTPCNPAACPPATEACCCCGNCFITVASYCSYMGGTPQPVGATCNPSPCGPPSGACCDATGLCTQTTQGNCPVPPNLSWTPNTACVPNPCTPCPLGGCCDINGLCSITDSCNCWINGGSFLGAGVPCSNGCGSPVFGACCINSNASCVNTTQAACTAFGQQFFAGTTCGAPGLCTAGVAACCCCNTCYNIDPSFCAWAGGVPTPGIVCAPGGPCIPPIPGACCDANSICTITTSAACPTPPNISWTAGGTCNPNPCPPCPSTGACCLWAGGCNIDTECNCVLNGGYFAGQFTTCGSTNCANIVFGSCCLPLGPGNAGGCVDLDQGRCTTLGGTFTIGQACVFNPCGSTSAACCCCGFCYRTDPNLCSMLGGTPYPQSNCGPPLAPCVPLGACCGPNGNCTQTLSSACPVGPNISWTVAVSCTPNPCGPLGGCCDLNGICTVTTAALCPVPPNLSWTPASTCNPSPCPPMGGCCLPGGPCVITTSVGCATQSGSYLGNGSTCAGAAFQCPGACCTNAGPCIMGTFISCFGFSQFQGVGTVCTPTLCPTGACCAPNGTCTVTPPFMCTAPNAYQGNGTLCTPFNPCPGACCLINGGCSIANQFSCNGFFNGPGTTCTPGLCPTGACCQPNGSCFVTSPFGCPNFGGQTYMGNGSVCSPNPCLGSCCTGTIFGGMGHICTQTTFTNCATLNGQWKGYGTPCQNPPGNYTACCYANITGNGGINVGDIFAFLACYFTPNIPCADCDGNNIITVNDIFCFLQAYFTGCS